MSKEERYNDRRRRIKNESRFITTGSSLCVVLVPAWLYVRVFYCWEKSCSGSICWLCHSHFIISFLLIFFMLFFVLMAWNLVKVSKEKGDPAPHLHDVENPWVPGTKLAIRCTDLCKSGTMNLLKNSTSLPGMSNTIKAVQNLAKTKYVEPTIRSAANASRLIGETARHFENGRKLVEDDKPAIATFIFTIVGLGLMLYMIFNDFNVVEFF